MKEEKRLREEASSTCKPTAVVQRAPKQAGLTGKGAGLTAVAPQTEQPTDALLRRSTNASLSL